VQLSVTVGVIGHDRLVFVQRFVQRQEVVPHDEEVTCQNRQSPMIAWRG
jgi:hypothetical protein